MLEMQCAHPRLALQDMKPPRFSYHDPQTVSDAVELLTCHENAKLLALLSLLEAGREAQSS